MGATCVLWWSYSRAVVVITVGGAIGVVGSETL